MQHHDIGLCAFQQLACELIAHKIPQALLTFRRAGLGGVPHSRCHHIGILNTLGRVCGQVEGAAVLVGEHQHIRRRAVALRADTGDLHPSQQSAHDEAVCHAAAVADKAELPARKAAPALPNGHQVGQNLAGMGVIRQAVDHRHTGQLGKLFQIALAVGAPHHAVVVAAQHPGGVLEGLAPAGLQLGGVHVIAQAAHLVHTHLKAGAGAGGRLGEQHGHRFTGQQGGSAAQFLLCLELVGHIQDVGQLAGGQIAHFQQIFHACSFGAVGSIAPSTSARTSSALSTSWAVRVSGGSRRRRVLAVSTSRPFSRQAASTSAAVTS